LLGLVFFFLGTITSFLVAAPGQSRGLVEARFNQGWSSVQHQRHVQQGSVFVPRDSPRDYPRAFWGYLLVPDMWLRAD
jgi:hypothetical protein